MLSSKVAKRYAKGLLDYTQETGNTAAVAGEMGDLVKTIHDSRELQNFFASPVIDQKKKASVAKAVFTSFSTVAQNLIQLVILHGRENQLSSIAQEYINKVEDLNGIQRITLTTAEPLAQANVERILASTNLVNKNHQYDLKTVINPEILGGYILRVGDQQVDTSVRSKLITLRKDFQLN